MSFLPLVSLVFDSKNVFQEPDPIQILMAHDPHPFESLGFVIFLAIGVAIAGYHDGDTAKQSITVFSKGRWDPY